MSVLPVGFGSALGGYQIERSLRFNSADSAYLNRTPASSGNRQIWTISFWVKRAALSSGQQLFGVPTSANEQTTLSFGSANTLVFEDVQGGVSPSYFTTTQVFRDVSAWYHIVLHYNTTNATSSNRWKLYVNGAQITTFSSSGYPSQNYSSGYINSTSQHRIGDGQSIGGIGYLSAYLTEINFVDGQALTPSSFGETDSNTGVWKPKAFSGTYGTNGFYLKFADNSGTTSTTLGKDSSGNGNNWTPNNFSVTAGAGNDSLVDSPTSYGTDTGVGGTVRGNYATLNPVWKNLYPGVYANGNLDFSTSTAKYGNAFSTIGLTSGKWYVEVLVSGTIGSALKLGVSNQTTLNYLVGTEDDITPTTGVGYGYYLTNGNKATNGTTSAYGTSVASGDIVGIILDLDNGKIWFSKNGTVQASGDPVAGTNAAFTGITASSVWFFGGTTYATQASFVFNFGQRAFAYTAPSGFKALCTQNLPTPTIGATSTTQANDYFDVTTFTGNASTNTIVNSGSMQPDMVWLKSRSNANNHTLYDAVRGVNIQLYPNLTNAEDSGTGLLTSFNSNGFTLGASQNSNDNNGESSVGWQWRAAGSTVSNTAGTITSTVSASTTSGFSIVTYTGNGSAGSTVGHGLGASPSWIITKSRSNATNWMVWTDKLTTNYALEGLNTTGAEVSGGSPSKYIRAVSSTTFTIGDDISVNQSASYTYVAYCFAPVAGYSAFGIYSGTGSAPGAFTYLGFKPAFVLIKESNGVDGWGMYDDARDPNNVVSYLLQAQDSGAESSASANKIDFLSNGFRVCTDGTQGNFINESGKTYIYAAFAETPFKYSLAR